MSRKWYADGLHFSCQQCGKCCTGEPGYVWVTKEELREIAEFLKISEKQLRAKYTHRAGWRISLTESANGDCAFLADEKCTIYPVRPAQYRNWPFWNLNLENQSAWNRAAQRCCGINKGEFYSFEKIEEERRLTTKNTKVKKRNPRWAPQSRRNAIGDP